jgi:hypothetical protein
MNQIREKKGGGVRALAPVPLLKVLKCSSLLLLTDACSRYLVALERDVVEVPLSFEGRWFE